MIKNSTKDFTSDILNYINKTRPIYLDFDDSIDNIDADCFLVIHNLNKKKYVLKAKASFCFNKMKCVVTVDNQELERNNLFISDNYYNYLLGNYVSIYSYNSYIPRAFICSFNYSEDFNLIFEVSSNQIIRNKKAISDNNIDVIERKYYVIMFHASWKIGDFEYEESTDNYFFKLVKVRSSQNIVRKFGFILFYTPVGLSQCLNKIYEINNYFSFIYRCVSKISEIYVLSDDVYLLDNHSFEKVYNSDTVEYQDHCFNPFSIPPLQRFPVFELSNKKNFLFYSWDIFFRSYKKHLWFVDSFSSTLARYNDEILYPQNNFLLSLFYVESIWRPFFNTQKQIEKSKDSPEKKKRISFKRLLKEACSICITEQLQCFFTDIIPEKNDGLIEDYSNKLQDKIADYLYYCYKQFKVASSKNNRKVNYDFSSEDNYIVQYNQAICAFNLLLISLLYAYFGGSIRYVEQWIMQSHNFLVKPIEKRFYNLGL